MTLNELVATFGKRVRQLRHAKGWSLRDLAERVNVGFTYLNPPTLAPGERASYEVIFTYFPKYVSQKVIPFEE